MMRLDPAGPVKRDPPAPHAMTQPITATPDLIVLCHFGVPRLSREHWSMRIEGLVQHPMTLDFEALSQYPRAEVTTVHECCGSPFEPSLPTRRVGNVTWAGARLADILADCRPLPQARYVWSRGADGGVFGDAVIDAYVKDLPLSRVPDDVLICYELNGEPLPAEHGFPARLIVPGFYGTNSVKWLTSVVLADRRADGPMTTRWYQDPPDATGDGPKPVWSIAPESLIVSPAAGKPVRLGDVIDIWGWAWADDGISGVEVRIDDAPWHSAHVQPPDGRQWQRFTTRWRPDRAGPIEMAARATSNDGQVQPSSGRRNEIHRVSVMVG